MSKLYKQYLDLKNSNNTKIYLFKNGIFYIALEDDAIYLAELFNLKLTNFGNTTLKCGFPEGRLDYYIELFKEKNIEYIIIENITAKSNNKTESITLNKQSNLNIEESSTQYIYKLANLDINNFTLKTAFDKLYDIHLKAKEIINRKDF